jgi:uncharacterized phage protein (TIGR01671 family)
MREIKFRAWIITSELGNTVNEMAYHDSHILFGRKYEDDTEMILMQYTGLKDKNGKEIYEGDLMGINDYEGGIHYYEVKFGAFNGRWGYFLEDKYGAEAPYYDDFTKRYEVFGKIYQNPELIK